MVRSGVGKIDCKPLLALYAKKSIASGVKPLNRKAINE